METDAILNKTEEKVVSIVEQFFYAFSYVEWIVKNYNEIPTHFSFSVKD